MRGSAVALVSVWMLFGACGTGEEGVEIVAGLPDPLMRAGGPALAILMPQPGEVVQNPVRVEFVIDGFKAGVHTDERGMATAVGGQHLHLVVDDEPPIDVFRITESITLDELAPGTHSIRLFPARAWHEGIKTPGAFEAVQFFVARREGEPPIQPGAPLLTYSMPSGTFAAMEADTILLDFFLRNAQLGRIHRLEVTIDGARSQELTAWVPYYLMGHSPGEHTIRLRLTDNMGRPVPGTYNTVTRSFTIDSVIR